MASHVMDGKNSNERKSGHAQQFTSMTSCALVSGGKTASQGDGKELKDRNMLGFAPLFGRVVFPRGRLPSTHPFSFKKTIAAPLAMPGASLRSYRTIEYHQLCTGGFNRICTRRGRVYWLAQNEHGHRTPDWKVHFSIRLDHLAVAWDVLAATFLDHACETGIKVCVGEALGRGRWPAGQRGREITLYMFTHARSSAVEVDPVLRICRRMNRGSRFGSLQSLSGRARFGAAWCGTQRGGSAPMA